MATLKDKKDVIKNGPNYVAGSLIVKAADDCGVVLKWLEKGTPDTTADRKERFVELDETEAKTIPAYDDRTAASTIDVNDPQ